MLVLSPFTAVGTEAQGGEETPSRSHDWQGEDLNPGSPVTGPRGPSWEQPPHLDIPLSGEGRLGLLEALLSIF